MFGKCYRNRPKIEQFSAGRTNVIVNTSPNTEQMALWGGGGHALRCHCLPNACLSGLELLPKLPYHEKPIAELF